MSMEKSNTLQYTVIISAQLLKHWDFYSQSNKRIGVNSNAVFFLGEI